MRNPRSQQHQRHICERAQSGQGGRVPLPIPADHFKSPGNEEAAADCTVEPDLCVTPDTRTRTLLTGICKLREGDKIEVGSVTLDFVIMGNEDDGEEEVEVEEAEESSAEEEEEEGDVRRPVFRAPALAPLALASLWLLRNRHAIVSQSALFAGGRAASEAQRSWVESRRNHTWQEDRSRVFRHRLPGRVRVAAHA